MFALSPRRSITLAAAGAFVVAPLLIGGVANAGTEPVEGIDADAQASAEAGIAAFETLLTDAGLQPTGPGQEGDIIGISGTADAAGEEGNPDACIAHLASTIADDGSFVGEVLRVTSNNFSPATPESTDPMAIDLGGTTYNAVIAVGDDTGVESFEQIIETFASDELSACMSDALEIATAGTAMPEGFSLDYEFGSVDLGDAGARLTASGTQTFDDETMTFGFDSRMVRSGNLFVIVSADTSGEDAGGPSIDEATEAILDAIG